MFILIDTLHFALSLKAVPSTGVLDALSSLVTFDSSFIHSCFYVLVNLSVLCLTLLPIVEC